MVRQSKDTVSDIVKNAEGLADDNESDDDMLDTIKVNPETGEFVIEDDAVRNAAKFAPSIADAREVAQILPQMSVSEMVGATVVIVAKKAQQAYNVDKSAWSDGYQCLCVDVKSDKNFTMWIGQVALMRDLNTLPLPLRVTIARIGNRYRFH